MSVRAILTGKRRLRRALADAGAGTETAAIKALGAGAERIAQNARQRVQALRNADRPAESRLAESIAVENDGSDIVIVARAPYAPFVEFGTRHMAAQPFLTPALAEHRARIREHASQSVEEALSQAGV